MSDDPYNRSLLKFLGELGYRAHGWNLGRNLGPGNISLREIAAAVRRLERQSGGKVSLIGHSLGGIYAREIARENPGVVRQVITLGSPFGAGRDRGSNVHHLFKRLNPGREADPEHLARQEKLAVAPPVPTTSIYTRGDGIVNWRTSIQKKDHPETQNIEVPGSHCGLTHNPTVWYLIADRLRQPEDLWQPFNSRVFRHH
ncbi:alpha/beta fold hydrolase [Parahaliea maris]|nr:alpha/beta fold hydrolase [Parahaliea maris]